jgi:dTDP-4-amino-4,6-dideoxygalactose transaminase
VLDAASADAANSHYCLVAVLTGPLAPHRNEIVGRLNAAGVGTSVYYPQPVPRMKYYRDKYGYEAARFPVASQLSDESIALPVGQHLGGADMEYIGQTLSSIVREYP